MTGATITGWGAALPPGVLTNAELVRGLDTSDEWIRERTGIEQRRIGGTTSSLAAEAGRAAMRQANVSPEEIDLLLLATTSPEMTCPGTSPKVQHLLGLQCGALDVQAACSGWVAALITANGFLQQGLKKILVIGSETLSRITDYTDRNTGILFGDGAGAVVLEATDGQANVLGWDLGADGSHADILYARPGDTLVMDGKEIFRQAVAAMVHSTRKCLERAELTVDDVDWIVPHQANIRIIEAAWKRLGFSLERTVTVLQHTGNTSAASIPLGLSAAADDERFRPGHNVLLLGFGAGMTWASMLVRWDPEAASRTVGLHSELAA